MRPSFLRARLLAALAVLALTPAARATDYDVGPGQPLASIGAVPWESLAPGDRVRIHWRAAPYAEKWVIGRRGTAAAPIVVSGVRGPGGERPVVTGENATTRLALDYWNEERSVIKIGGANVPADTLPAWIVVEGLEIRSARPPLTFVDADGVTRSYIANAAAIYVEKAEHLVVRDCVLRDAGNGLFVSAFDGQTQDVLIDGNHIFGNGNAGSGFEHNTYTAAIGITYQYNRFGPPCAGCGGNALKDRSAGLVVRYNWIEGGNRQLDLVDAEDSAVLVAHPSYRRTWVYGNVLVEPDGAGNSQIVHYGGDSGTVADYRKGLLHFFHNTLVSKRSGNTTLLRLSTDDETADVRDNLLYVTAAGNRLAMLDEDGVLALSHNWTKTGWVESHSGLPVTVDDDGTGIEGTSPGFVDEAGQDFHLAAGSPALDQAGPLHPEAVPDHLPQRQYLPHQAGTPRPDDGAADLGAFERCPDCLLFTDGFESGDTTAWSDHPPIPRPLPHPPEGEGAPPP